MARQARGDILFCFVGTWTRSVAVVAGAACAFAAGSAGAGLRGGQLDQCMVPWEESVRIDPEHWISQEQIWVRNAPERFHPWIDVAWQNRELAAQGRPVCACELDL